MNASGDHDADMSPEWQIDDDTVEAIVLGDAGGDRWTHLFAFARQVQELEEAPAPTPSAELASLLNGTDLPQLSASAGHDSPAEPASVAALAEGPFTATGQPRQSNRRQRMPLVETLAAKVAGAGMLAKAGLCASAAAATGVGAVGVHSVTSGGDGAEVATDASAGDVTTGADSGVSADKGVDANVKDVAGADAGLDGANASTGVGDVNVSGDSVGINLNVPVKQLFQQYTLEEVLSQVSLEELLQQYTLEEVLSQVSLEDLLAQVSLEDLLAQVPLSDLVSVVPADELLQVVSVEDLLAAGVPVSEVQKHLPDAQLPEVPAELPEVPEVPGQVPEVTTPVPLPAPGGVDTNLGG